MEHDSTSASFLSVNDDTNFLSLMVIVYTILISNLESARMELFFQRRTITTPIQELLSLSACYKSEGKMSKLRRNGVVESRPTSWSFY